MLCRLLLSFALAISASLLPFQAAMAEHRMADRESVFGWHARPAVEPMLLARKPGSGVSEGEAVRIAQQRYGGKAVKVERGGGAYYVRLLLPNGRVKMVVVDAASGSVSD